MMDAHAIHSVLGAEGWRYVLKATGIDEKFLSKKHGPCPACGGKDRFRFDNKNGRGDFICNQCGAGDGFKLIMQTQGVTFAEARALVIDHGRLSGSAHRETRPVAHAPAPVEIAKPTRRVLALLRESCAVEDCDAAIVYLRGRGLWPLPKGHGLKAHPSVEYWQDSQSIGRFPALLAGVRDMCGELVTVHVTYLEQSGEKLKGFESRKLLSGLSGRDGCAVPLMQLDGGTLGIAEGIETALSASIMHSVPVWAALNTSLLQKFEPPEQIGKLLIFSDRDIAGLDAATKLMQKLQEKVRLEIRTPQAKDWNDALMGAA